MYTKIVKSLKSGYKKYHVLLSLTVTPFIIFGITSIELYINNRFDLGNRMVVLLPFLGLFMATLLFGYLLDRYQDANKLLKPLLIVYYILGPLFFFVPVIRQLQVETLLKTAIFAIVLVAAGLYIYKNVSLTKLANFFALLALLLMGYQSIVVIAKTSDTSSLTSKVDIGEKSQSKELPNIYHIVLDEYQTDMFDLTLNEEVKEELGGFVYYPENTTIFGRTGMSLPSIFTGRAYDYKTPQIKYQEPAFNSDKSFLYWLKKAGYGTRAFIHKVYTFNLGLFDEVIEHQDNAQTELGSGVYTRLFLDLWLYANTPKIVAEKLVEPEFLEQVEAQNALPATAPVLSHSSFNNIIQDKEGLNKPNSYTFVHLILPHFPYVLQPDCSYDEATESSPLEQSECTTKLVLKFLDTLKSLGRYDDSLIIVQSDHGGRFKLEDGNLVSVETSGNYSEEWSLARARTLLLVKTPGRNSTDPFIASTAETTLLDLAPTVIESVGIETNMTFDGFSLADPARVIPERARYYHFFDKKGKNEFTDQMSRYIFENGRIKFDRVIPIGQ